VVDVAIIDTPPMNRKISFRIALSFRSGLASAAWNSRSRKANLVSNIKMGFLMLVQKCRMKNIFFTWSAVLVFFLVIVVGNKRLALTVFLLQLKAILNDLMS
jgi:hypothetical protein